MSGAKQQQHPLPIRDEFRNLLELKWTRHVACQNECRPIKSCTCQRKIVHVHAMEAWWTKKPSDSPNNTKLDRFLDEMRVPPHRNLPVRRTEIFRSGQSCIRILSLLLEQGRDHLIDRFYEANMYDHYLTRSESDQNLGENLREHLAVVVPHGELETIIGDFHKKKWQWCPLNLTLEMNENLHGTKVVPPFCLKIKLPDKGGTASIYWVAVQKDLISDNALALALQDSIYTDEEFGECYQMVLKSYCGNKKRDFELEKEAFSGLQSNDQVPILKYLGSYTHDYGEGKGIGKTYNLLLEYGENDLYQAWADETNVPPVQAQEILQSWKSLFKVAEAIRHVHHLEILRGKDEPWKFHGWHADIKPDNILSVRGRLKLADFGFSSFAPVLEGHGGSEPTDVIRGFTDTYGAPEVSRMKQPDGTLSGVSQSIDAWSFGCVLSVAATWIVLGFQGLRQYERLRQLSPANNKDGITSDRFHDGFHVLPEIEKWHDYLRGHLRRSDTTTELVLDLIERKLLRAHPQARYNLEELCAKLQELSDWAGHRIEVLNKHSKEPHPLVMKALSNIEEEAQSQNSSESKGNLLQQPLIQGNPRERASMQITKEDLIRNKPLGQTAHRKQILEKKLEGCHVMKINNEPFASSVHNGAVTDSPTDWTPPKESQFTSRKPRPRNPHTQEVGQLPPDVGHHTPNGAGYDMKPAYPATPPSDRQPKFSGAGAVLYKNNALPLNLSPGISPDQEKRNLHIITTDSISESNGTLGSPFLPKEKRPSNHDPNLPPSSFFGPGKRVYTEVLPSRTPQLSNIKHDVEDQGSPSTAYPMNRQRYGGAASVVADKTPTGFPSDRERANEPVASLTKAATNPGPAITVSHPGEDQSSQERPETPLSSAYVQEMQAVQGEPLRTQRSARSDESSLQPLPDSALSLPYDVCVKRRELSGQVPTGFSKGLAKVKGRFGIETIASDSSLRDTFSNPRELIFVVDNGWTMSTHWPVVTFVAQTLAKSAAGLDKSGFDLKFTVDGHKHKKERLKGDSGRNKLKDSLKAAWPEYKVNDHATTDMARVFADISQEWDNSGRPATTLLVLTDGVWSNTNLDVLNQTILDIARNDVSHAGNRHFSIQFIRFGDGEAEKSRLQWLDDALCVGHQLRDIIDHCSWRATVDKMFKGSIEGYHDEQDSDEEPIVYDYTKLVDLFATYNRAEDSTLSPTKDLFRSPSRSSHRSSTSLSHLRNWARQS